MIVKKIAQKKLRLNHLDMITSTLILISLLAAGFLIAGCTGLTTPKAVSEVQVYKGTEGIYMNFLNNAPPAELYAPPKGQKTDFTIAVQMENRGAFDIREGYLILGLEENYMEASQWMFEDKSATQIGAGYQRVAYQFKGKSKIDPAGQKDILTINAKALPLDAQSQTHTSAITLTTCYGYKTTATADVCIDTDVYNTKPLQKACIVKDVTLSGGQGGPVSVTKVEVKMLPDSEKFVRPQFIIHLTNNGGGLVVDQKKVQSACSSESLKTDDFNAIDIEEVTFSGYSTRTGQIKCEPPRFKLGSSMDYIRCTLEKGLLTTENPSYGTALQATLGYGYTKTISKQVEIKKA